MNHDRTIDGDLLEAIFKALPNPIFFRDLDLKFERCNDSFCDFIGAAEAAILGRGASELCPVPMLGAISESDRDILTLSAPRSSRTFAASSGGPERTYLLSSNPVYDARGSIRGLAGMISDVSPLVESERKIERLMRLKDAILAINASILGLAGMDQLFDLILEKVLAAVDHADVGCVLLLDEDRMLRIVASLGYPPEESKGFRVRLEDSFQWKRSKNQMDDTLIINDLQEFMASHEMRDDLLRNEGGHVIRSSMSAPLVIDGDFYGLINLDSGRNNVFDDTDRALMEYVRMQVPIAISTFKSYELKVRDSERDRLTDAYNRRHFESVFAGAQGRALRYSERFSLVLFDINDLKKVNDSIGHLAGDMVLQRFAAEMKAWLRSSDVFARYGGDEFVALMHRTKGERLMRRLDAQRLLLSGKPIEYKGSRIGCVFSYGIANFGKDGTSYEELIAVADKRMYEDKARIKAARGLISP